jgi:hypothetical protein
MMAFFETRFKIYARLLQRGERSFSGDGLESDDFFFAIISGARARAE